MTSHKEQPLYPGPPMVRLCEVLVVAAVFVAAVVPIPFAAVVPIPSAAVGSIPPRTTHRRSRRHNRLRHTPLSSLEAWVPGARWCCVSQISILRLWFLLRTGPTTVQ